MLKAFFEENPKLALAFSGGVDSAYLLYAAVSFGADVKAYYVKTPFQPEFEYEDALRLANQLGAEMVTIHLDVLSDDAITENPKNRCYFCKKRIFNAILEQAKRDGYSLIIDGTNASDDAADRPGMAALKELEVRSPLRECGLTKEEIRRLSKDAGLFTHDKPAYACLATRIPTGTPITAEKLAVTEQNEGFLRSLGFKDFRIRFMGTGAKLQVSQQELPLLLENRETILKKLKNDYTEVLLDLEVR
ncbi:MAG: ATP-dependent sacrificial sulfur transferase LarE [Oscillospiraceae bacterium]|nr:ATP-dependent sacrificial sulfur transferase LarE [Oscillospiraceae bacterium]MBQ8881489.1 ATP-dependent sacrificial sulfur transferase LarE [Oscillospiraceae bacterium]